MLVRVYFESTMRGPVGPESGSVTVGKGDSFVGAGFPCGF